MNEGTEQTTRPEETVQGFDLRTVIRDPRTGKTIKEQHYKRYCSDRFGEFYERDGKFFAPNGAIITDPRIQKTETQAAPTVETKLEASTSKKA